MLEERSNVTYLIKIRGYKQQMEEKQRILIQNAVKDAYYFTASQTSQTKIHDRQNSATSKTAISALLVDLPPNISLPSAHFHNSGIMLICLT